MQVRVKRISLEADNINSYELMSPDGGDLAPFTAGSHIDLHLPNGMIRSYSLVNDQSERNRYVIAVNNDAASRGGSKLIHETVRVGDVMTISHPRNNFALHEDAAHSVLIAGGIGITPLLSMIRRLEALGRSWELFYAARTRLTAAFLDELKNLRADVAPNLHLNFDGEPPARMIDLSAIVKAAAARGASLLLRPGADARGLRGGGRRSALGPRPCRVLQGQGKAGGGGWLRGEAGAEQPNDRGAGRARPSWTRCWKPESPRTTPVPKAFAAPARPGSSKVYRTIGTCFSARRSRRPTKPS